MGDDILELYIKYCMCGWPLFVLNEIVATGNK